MLRDEGEAELVAAVHPAKALARHAEEIGACRSSGQLQARDLVQQARMLTLIAVLCLDVV